jgi:hypothetical protein
MGFGVKSLPEVKLGLYIFRETINSKLYGRLILSHFFYHMTKEEKSHGNIID